MKDIIITKKRIWIEIAWIILMFLVAEGLNIYAIMKHQTQWSEMWTQLHFIIILAMVFYALLTALRMSLWMIIQISKYFYTKR